MTSHISSDEAQLFDLYDISEYEPGSDYLWLRRSDSSEHEIKENRPCCSAD